MQQEMHSKHSEHLPSPPGERKLNVSMGRLEELVGGLLQKVKLEAEIVARKEFSSLPDRDQFNQKKEGGGKKNSISLLP